MVEHSSVGSPKATFVTSSRTTLTVDFVHLDRTKAVASVETSLTSVLPVQSECENSCRHNRTSVHSYQRPSSYARGKYSNI